MINLIKPERVNTFWGTGENQLPSLPETIFIDMNDCPTELDTVI